MLHEGLNELLAQTGQAVAMLSREALLPALGVELLPFHGQEVEVRRKSA